MKVNLFSVKRIKSKMKRKVSGAMFTSPFDIEFYDDLKTFCKIIETSQQEL